MNSGHDRRGGRSSTRQVSDAAAVKPEQERARLASVASAALRRASELDAVLDSLTAMVVLYDADGVPVRPNAAARTVLGPGLAGPLAPAMRDQDGRPLEGDAHPVATALSGERVDVAQARIEHEDGREHLMLVSAFPLTHGSRVDGAAMILQDATEREGLLRRLRRAKVAENALRESEERYRRESDLLRVVMENTHACLAYLDTDFRFVLVNSSFAGVLGKEPSELAGRSYFKVFITDENRHVFERVRDSGRAAHFEARPMEIPDQSWRGVTYWDWTLTPVKDSAGRTAGLALSLLDLTGRVRDERLRDGLNDIWATLNSTLDLDEVMRRVAREGAAVLGCEAAMVTVAEDGVWKVRQVWGMPSGVVGSVCPHDSPCPGSRAMRTRRPIVVEDTDEETPPCEIMLRYSRSAMVLPLVGRGRPIGCLTYMMLSKTREFTDAEMDFGSKVASAASLSIDNAGLLEERKLTAERNEALSAIAMATGSTLDFDEILHRVVAETAAVLSCDSASVALHTEGKWSLRYAFGLPQECIGDVYTEESTQLIKEAASSLTAVPVPDAQRDPRVHRGFVERYGIRAAIAAPLRVGPRVFGVLFLNWHGGPHEPRAEELDFVDRVAATASYALENARLYAERKQADRLNETLNSVNAAINSTLEWDEIMERVLQEGSRAMECSAACILMRKGDGWTLTHGWQIPEDVVGRRLSSQDASYADVAASAARPLGIPDVRSHELDSPLAEELDLTACLMVPFSLKGEVQGVLELGYHERPFSFTRLQMDFARKLAYVISHALENSRLYEVERGIADTLQEALLTRPVAIEGLEFDSLYRSATEATRVGGDFYDLFELQEGKAGVLIGDVSGKGLDAAVLTSLVKNTIKAHAYDGLSPGEAMTKANQVVLMSSSESAFVTVFFAVLDMTTGDLTFCNAGHPPAILKRGRDGGVTLLGANSPIVGAFADLQFKEGVAHVAENDVLLLYTDGLTEARTAAGFYGEERLVHFVRDLDTFRPREVLRSVFQELMIGTRGILADDVAMVAASLVERRTGAYEPLKLWTED